MPQQSPSEQLSLQVPLTPASKPQDKSQAPQQPDHRKTLTPQAYAEAVTEHSKQATGASLYPGQNFENLAHYLLRPFEHRGSHNSTPAAVNHAGFPVTLYNFYPSKSRRRRVITTLEDLARTRGSQSQDDEAPSSSILFMRGQPSASWLSAVGAMYHIDPEYFQRHLDFRSTVGRLNYFSLPSLPSSSAYIIKLRYVTICQSNRKKASGQGVIDSLRSEGKQAFDRYMHSLNQHIEKGISPGNSIIRAYNVHDESHSSIEQEMSIYISRTTSGPICLVWLDTGKDLTQGPEGPWFKPGDRQAAWPSTIFHPTIQHQQQISLKSHRTAIGRDLRPEERFAQSSSLLHLDYGKLHDSSLMASDAFYALDELFTFCANSEVQLLNLMESKLSQETGYSLLSNENTQLSNLLYSQDILEDHAKRLRETIEVIKMRGGVKWPRASEPAMKQKAEAAANLLLRDYEHLLYRTEALSERCRRGIGVIISSASITESKRAIAQAYEVTKLTRLAFLYIPLSFTTSFFGMNLTPIAAGQHDLWLWVVVSIPILAVSIFALSYDISTLPERSGAFLSRIRNWRW